MEGLSSVVSIAYVSFYEAGVHFEECRIKAIERSRIKINVWGNIKKTISNVSELDTTKMDSYLYIWYSFVLISSVKV